MFLCCQFLILEAYQLDHLIWQSAPKSKNSLSVSLINIQTTGHILVNAPSSLEVVKRVSLHLCSPVPYRMVPLRVRRADGGAEREVVLSAVHRRDEEKGQPAQIEAGAGPGRSRPPAQRFM